MRFRSTHWLAAACLAAIVTLRAGPPAAGESLYADLGGEANIDRFTAETLAIVVKDPRIARDFDNADLDRLHRRFALYLCQVTGGPCLYRGREVAPGSQPARLDFNAFAEDLQIAIDHTEIPYWTRHRLLALLAPLPRDVASR